MQGDLRVLDDRGRHRRLALLRPRARAALLRGAGARRAAGQLRHAVLPRPAREVEADRARGMLSDDEAAATRVEVSRRLLAAADAEAAEAASGAAPRRGSRVVALATLVAGGRGGGRALRLARRARPRPTSRWPSGWRGRPRTGPTARTRLRPRRWPPRAAAEPPEPVPRTSPWSRGSSRVLESRPDDLEGHRLLAASLAGARALARGARRAGAGRRDPRRRRWPRATWSTSPRFAMLAAGGYVSPEAETALARALALEPGESDRTLLFGADADAGRTARPCRADLGAARGRGAAGRAVGRAGPRGPRRGEPRWPGCRRPRPGPGPTPPTSRPRRTCRPRSGRR